jgi:hypothetical protein
MGIFDKIKHKVDLKDVSVAPSQPFPAPAPDHIGQDALVRYRKQRGVNLGELAMSGMGSV